MTDRYYDYGAWGEPHPMSVSTTDNPYLYVGQLGYYTHYQDAEFGLLQLGVRFYDPEVGRFTQRDSLPTRYGISSYPYADDVPAEAIDPTGMLPSVIDPGLFQYCQAKGGNVVSVSKWHRTVTRPNIKKIARCLKDKFCNWQNAAKVGICLIGCLPTFPAGYAPCVILCLIGNPEQSGEDVDKIRMCISDGLEKVLQEKTIYACQRNGVNYISEPEPPSWLGWIRDE